MPTSADSSAIGGTIAVRFAYAAMLSPPKPIALIVEDEALIRMLAVDAFLADGFEVLEAEHAAEAIRLQDGLELVHVLFTDVNMPGEMTGIDLAELLKARCDGLHVIITSALPILRTVDHIPATFVAKPYNAESVSRKALAMLAA